MAGLEALEALTVELYDFIQEMEAEGMVDSHFKQCYNLKELNGTFFFVELLPTYISDTQGTLEEMATILEETDVDYNKLEKLCIKLKGGTSCLGACRVATSCGELLRAAKAKNKEDCNLMLTITRGDFLILQNKLEHLLELERRIITNDYQGC